MSSLPAKDPSKEKQFGKVQAEVEEAIRRHSNDWQQLQTRILSRVREYQKSGTLRSAIYSIYSREDRQPPDLPHRHLKTSAKIAEEIFLNRFGGKKLRGGQLRDIPPEPKFTIYDVSDVIGITIVCPFDADVDRVSEQVESDCKEGGYFRAVSPIKRHDRRDYQAVHVSLKVEDAKLRELQCEVQIKTAVQDAFSWKTHALAYKPGENADPWFIEQFIRISVLLRTADSISDQLRGRLEEGRSVNSRKRKAVRSRLVLVFREHIAKIGDDEKRDDLRRVFDLLGGDLAAMEPKVRRTFLQDIERQVEGLFQSYGFDANTFRLGVACATAPENDGYLSRVDRHFYSWIATSDDPDEPLFRKQLEEWTRAANLLAIAHYYSNDVVGAVQIVEAAVRRAGDMNTSDIGQLHVNLAYYYAELASDASVADYHSKARDHAEKARAMTGGVLDPADLDSLGFVRIATGSSISEVEGGLADCRHALEELSKDAKQEELAKIIFETHRELAYKRLAQMVSSELGL